MNNITVFKARKWAFSFIEEHGKEKAAAEMLLCGQMHWNLTSLLVHLRDQLQPDKWHQYQQNVKRYVAGWPVQYILGNTTFYGLNLRVTPDTLIPRFETEELVDWILKDHSQTNLKVLDIGTGSGAIGLALKTHRPQWQVTMTDISMPALKIAQQNASQLQQRVTLIHSDLFNNITGKFDIIVSNPPYIAMDEIKYMDQSVLDHEPHQALFAKHHGLEFYQRIINECTSYLKNKASLYFEIGFHQGLAVEKIVKTHFPQDKVYLRKDINGKNRMIKLQREA